VDHQAAKIQPALARLSCETRSPLFQRDVTLYEELTDERGDKYRRAVGSAAWTQTPDRKSREFALTLKNGCKATPYSSKRRTAIIRLSNWKNSRCFFPRHAYCSRRSR